MSNFYGRIPYRYPPIFVSKSEEDTSGRQTGDTTLCRHRKVVLSGKEQLCRQYYQRPFGAQASVFHGIRGIHHLHTDTCFC